MAAALGCELCGCREFEADEWSEADECGCGHSRDRHSCEQLSSDVLSSRETTLSLDDGQQAPDQPTTAAPEALSDALETIRQLSPTSTRESFMRCLDLCFQAMRSPDEQVVSEAVRQMMQPAYDTLVTADGAHQAALFSLLVELGSAMSGACTRVRPALAATSKRGCVLILGYGGSVLDALEPYMALYAAEGFDCLSVVLPVSAEPLQELLLERVAHELRALLQKAKSFLVHICSNSGWFAWQKLSSMWDEGGLGHMHASRLEDLLTGMVHDCCPAQLGGGADGADGAVMNPELMRVYLLGVMSGVEAFLRIPAAIRDNKDKDKQFEQMVSGELFHAMKLDTGPFDLSARYVVPRLFLYSAADKLILPSLVEEYLDQLKATWAQVGVRGVRANNCIREVKSKYAPHMMMGAYEPDLFVGAIHNFVASHTGDCKPDDFQEKLPNNWQAVKEGFLQHVMNMYQP